jgi:hypothetical protein
MDLNAFTQAELHAGFSLIVLQIAALGDKARDMLMQTEKFDAKLSMDFIDAVDDAMHAAHDILMDSLKRQGLTDEQIQARIDHFGELFGDGTNT